MPKHASFESVEHMKHVLGEEARQQIQGVESQLAQIENKAFVSVTDFGAKLDGITDDNQALHDAISHCKANDKSLYIPAGTLVYTQHIRLFNGFRLFGDGMGVSTLKYNGTEDFAVAYRYSYENYELEDVTIENLGITTENQNVNLLDLQHSRFSDFRNLLISGGKNGVRVGLGWVILFDNCHVRHNKDNGFLFDSYHQGAVNIINVVHSSIERNGKSGIAIVPTMTDAGQGLQFIRNKIQYNGNDKDFSGDKAQVIVKGNAHTDFIGNYFEPERESGKAIFIIGGGSGSIMTYRVNLQDNYIGTATVSALESVFDIRDKIEDISLTRNTIGGGVDFPILKTSYHLLHQIKFRDNYYWANNPYNLIDGNVVKTLKETQSPSLATVGTNFIVDGDFENETFKWTVEGGASAWVDNSVIHTGTRSLFMRANNEGDKIVFTTSVLTRNANHIFSLYAKNNTSSAKTLKIDIFDKDGALLGNTEYTLGAYSPFIMITLPFRSADKPDKNLTIKLYGSEVYLDRMRLNEGVEISKTSTNPLDSYITSSTSGRPSNPFRGQMVYDRTLNKPIWCKSVNPNVWVDAMGTVV